MRRRIQFSFLAAVAVIAACAPSVSPIPKDVVQANNHTRPAGRMKNGVLTVHIETRVGKWRPEGDSGRVVDSIVAFAEVEGAASIPGPLIRVPVGTRVTGTVHNTLAKPLILVGLKAPHRMVDSLVIPADSTVPFDFAADKAGTFVYSALTHVDSITLRDSKEQQLNGAIIVDSPETAHDQVLAVSWYYTFDTLSKNGIGEGTMNINGLSWPHTERLNYAQGDSVHWQVINMTEFDHPMHLHGFFFRVDSRSANGVDTLYTADQQRMAVTEVVNPFQAVRLSWQADRPGNWVFHCHYALHVSDFLSLDNRMGVMDSAAMAGHPAAGPHQMFGLVVGITVSPTRTQVAAPQPDKRLRLIQREKPNVYGDQAGLSYVVDAGDGVPVNPSAMPVPAPTLILERGKRVQVTIVNQSRQHAAVHWHGIELESYPDGVPGWSGNGKDLLPAINPHDSLTVRWTPPRAGSYMYHSHFNEMRQMGGGLYGPIIVLDPGEKYDPETDKVLFFGTAGTQTSFLMPPPAVVLNGSAHPGPMTLRAGITYRLRFFNLAGDAPTYVALRHNGTPAEWRAVAKDGYALPASQATTRPSELLFDPGEIYDFEFTPAKAGAYSLSFGFPQVPPPSAVPPLVNVVVNVR